MICLVNNDISEVACRAFMGSIFIFLMHSCHTVKQDKYAIFFVNKHSVLVGLFYLAAVGLSEIFGSEIQFFYKLQFINLR